MAFSVEVTLDSVDAPASARFWEHALAARRLYERHPYIALEAGDGLRVLIQQVDAVPTDKSPAHLDLRVDDPSAEVVRLGSLGATVVGTVDERHAGGVHWTVMRAPDGLVFCVCPAR